VFSRLFQHLFYKYIIIVFEVFVCIGDSSKYSKFMCILLKCLYGWASVHFHLQVRIVVPPQRVDTETEGRDRGGQLVLHDRGCVCVCRERLQV